MTPLPTTSFHLKCLNHSCNLAKYFPTSELNWPVPRTPQPSPWTRADFLSQMQGARTPSQCDSTGTKQLCCCAASLVNLLQNAELSTEQSAQENDHGHHQAWHRTAKAVTELSERKNKYAVIGFQVKNSKGNEFVYFCLIKASPVGTYPSASSLRNPNPIT